MALSYDTNTSEKGTWTTVSRQVKVNLTSGRYLSRSDRYYLSAGRVGNECRSRCARWPNYQCSRNKGHDGDHAAHGWAYGVARRLIVMYARWSQ